MNKRILGWIAAAGFVAALLSFQLFDKPAFVWSVDADIDRLEHKIQARDPKISPNLLLMHLKASDETGTLRPVQQILDKGAGDRRDWVVLYFSHPSTGTSAAVFIIQDGQDCLFGRFSSRSVAEQVQEDCGDFDIASLNFQAEPDQANVAFDGASRVVTVSVNDQITSHLKINANDLVSGYEVSPGSVAALLKQAQDSSWDY